MPLYASGLFYVALTMLLFRNLLPHITTHIYSDLGDPLINTSILAWNAWRVPLTGTWWDFPAFAPLHGVTAFTEHFLLVYPVASPVIWLTGNAVLAYNIVFLLVWPVNALAGYALAHELTGSRSAAFVGGLCLGFAPFLAVHTSHLQLLLLFGMPLSLVGLHRYLRTHSWRDAAIFGAGWLATGLASAYTLIFFPILIAVWCVWFVRPREWRALVPAAIAGVVASLPLLPLLLGYASRHAAFGLARSYAESRVYAADVAGLISISHREWLWSGWFPMTYGEGSIFPGVTVAGLAIVAVLSRVRPAAERRARWSSGLLVASGVLMLIVLARIFAGSSGWHLGAMTLPPFRPYRVFTFAVLLLMAAALTAERFRSNWRRRDPVIFYAVAAVIFWLLALGPEPTWAGERILTYGPYRLFFELHVPAVVRVTARAWLVVLPCLAVLAAFGTMWLTDRFPRHRHIVLVLCAALVIAESWFVDGTKAAPLPLPAGVIPMGATVLDVPFDDPFVNAAAQYRAVLGGYRTINGYSGYEAAHLTRLRMAFKEMRYDSIDDYHRTSDLYVIVRPDADPIFARWLATRGVDARPGQSQSVVYRLRSAR